jgi:hypothetical protein
MRLAIHHPTVFAGLGGAEGQYRALYQIANVRSMQYYVNFSPLPKAFPASYSGGRDSQHNNYVMRLLASSVLSKVASYLATHAESWLRHSLHYNYTWRVIMEYQLCSDRMIKTDHEYH